MEIKNRRRIIFWSIIAIAFFSSRAYLWLKPSERNLEDDKDVIDKVEDIVTSGPMKPSSRYEGNSLKDGESPFDKIYGKGAYAQTKHSLLIRNQGSSDVVIFLVSKSDDRVIRNEYINSNSTFEMTGIPNSTCYLKYYYGKNWNPERQTKGFLTGGFDDDEQHIVSNNEDDLLKFQEKIEGNYIYSANFEITLETIRPDGNTLSEKPVTPSSFF